MVHFAFVLLIWGILFAFLGPPTPYQARVLSPENWIQELSSFLERDCLLLPPWFYKKHVGSWNVFFPALESYIERLV